MDQLSLVVDHCAAFGHAFAFQDAEILGQVSDQTVRETLEAWRPTTTSINRCVTLPAAYQALRIRFNRQGYRRVVRPETALLKPEPSGNADGHRQAPGTDEAGGQPAANANPGDRLLGPNADRRQHSMRTPDSDRNPQPDVNSGMTTTVNAVTGRCERGRKARCVEGGQRTMQTRAMAAVTPAPLPSPHPTEDEEEPMPPWQPSPYRVMPRAGSQ
nr:unnamed protein product [Spirometra erinaceieuropaei]